LEKLLRSNIGFNINKKKTELSSGHRRTFQDASRLFSHDPSLNQDVKIKFLGREKDKEE
jgi:hypothetical protein